MESPKIVNELLIRTCPNPAALWIEIATPRALEWILAECRKYTSDPTFGIMLESKTTPCSTCVEISPCFDILEVKAYLERPKYPVNKPIRLA